MTLVTSQTLLDLTNTQQPIPLHDPTQLPNQSDVLADVPTQLPELGVLLNEPFHVGYGFDGGRVGGERFGLEVLDVGCERGSEVTEVREEMGGEERVVGG